MTNDEDLDPPVPSYLERIEVKRVHDGKVIEEDYASSPADEADSAS